MSSSPGAAPGISLPQPTGLSEGSAKVTAQSLNGFNGIVDLSGSCCREAIRNRFIDYAGTGFVVTNIMSSFLSLSANGAATTDIHVSIPTASFGNPAQVPFGKYIFSVTGKQQGGSLTASTEVGFRVLPASEPHSSCRPSTLESFSLLSVLEGEMTNSEAATPKAELVIAGKARTTPDVWRMTITDDGSVGPTESIVELENNVSWEKEITTAGCSTFAKSQVVNGGQVGTIHLMQHQDRTIVFRKPVCNVPACLTTHMEDVAVFSETLFWSVFGGKRVRFSWLQD